VISGPAVDLWIFFLLILFLLLGVQTARYLSAEMTLRRERRERRERLESDRLYPIFHRNPQIRFEIFYDTALFLTVENRESAPLTDVSITVTVPTETISLIKDIPPGITKIPLDVDLPYGDLELQVDLRYAYKFQQYSERITRQLSINPPEKDTLTGRSLEEIKREYRVLVKKYHPDLARTEEERRDFESKLGKINEEYSRLLKDKRSITK
jgi:hypothetical protein